MCACMRRAVIVANKWWEADPLVGVLSSGRCSQNFVAAHNAGVAVALMLSRSFAFLAAP